jgi:trimeric autotransporter adhesin
MKKTFLGVLIAVFLSISGYSQETVTIGGESPSNTSKYVPVHTNYNYSYSQTVYLADEIGAIGTISSLSYYIGSHSTVSSSKTIALKIYMAQTNQTTITEDNYLSKSNLTLVYNDSLVLGPDAGWKTITLDSTFELADGENLVIAVEASMGTYFSQPSWGTYATTSQCRYGYSDSSMPTTVGNPSYSSPAIKLVITEPTSLCSSVKNLKASTIDYESAKASWSSVSGSTGYQYQYKTSSQSWDDLTDADLNTTTDTTITITGLTATTNYNLRVRNVCSTDTYSAWKSTSFKTACAYLTEDNIPYIMDPDYEETGKGKIPSCWTRLNTTHTDYPMLQSSGDLYMYYNCSVALNGYTDDITALQLSFFTKPAGTTMSYGTLEVGIMTDLTDETTYTSIKTLQANTMDGSWTKVEVPFDTYTLSDDAEAYYVVIKHTEPSNMGYSWSLSDITLEHLPDCKAATNVNTTLGSDNMTISWTAGDSISDWTVYYWEEDYTDTLSVSVTDTFAVITGLNSQTWYDFYIETNCGEYHPKTVVYDVETKCATEKVTDSTSFVADFSDDDLDLSCWEQNSWWVNNNKGCIYVAYTNNDLILPTIDIEDVTTPYLKIKHQNIGTQIKISYRASFSDAWTELVTLDESDTTTDLIALPNASSTYELKINNMVSGKYANICSLEIYNEANPPACSKAKDLTADVTATSVTLTWSQPDDAPEWIVYYKADTAEAYTESEALIDTTYTFVANPQTTYSAYVVTACGDDPDNYPESVEISFTTPCVSLTLSDLPKTWDFESNNKPTATSGVIPYSMPICWQRLGSTTTPAIKGGSSYAHGGDSCLSINGASSTGYYGILPAFDTTGISMSELQLSFYAMTTTKYGAKCALVVGIMTDPTDKTTFTRIDSIDLATSYTLYEIPFTAYQGQGEYIALKVVGTSYQTNAYIDDVVLQETPSCIKPQELTASNLTTTTATISWTQGGEATEWNLYYKTADAEEYITETNITETSYELTNLTNSTVYSVYVAAVCDDTLLSTSPITFQTPCLPLTFDDLPSTMDFENETLNELPTCWTGVEMYSTNYSSYPRVSSSSTSAYAGSKYLNMYYNNTIAMRGYQGDISALQVSLQARPGYNTSGYGTLEIGVQTNLSDTNTYQSIKVYNATEWGEPAVYKKLIVPFDAVEVDDVTTTYYVILKHTEPVSNGNFWYIDDMKLELKPDCAEATDVTVTNIEGSTATVSWTQSDESTSWTLYYKAANDDSYQSVDVENDPTYDLTGLTPQTDYTVYITTDCTGDEPSTSPLTFRTGCSDEGMTISNDYTYIEDFVGQDGDFPECWLKLNTSTTNETKIAKSSYNAKSGDTYLTIQATATNNQPMVILPKITNDLTELRLEFYAKAESSTKSGDLELGYMTDVTDTSTFVVLTSYSKANTYWTKYIVDMDEYVEELANVSEPRLAFRHNDSTLTSSYWYYALDSLVVKLIPTCKEAKDVVVNMTSSTASISWTSDASGFNIVVIDTATNDTIATETEYSTADYELTELTPSTTYTISITGVCSDNTLTPTVTKTFTTPCISITDADLPYTVNFDNQSSGYGKLPSCWTKLLGYSASYPYIIGTSSAHSGSNALNMYFNSMLALQPYEGDITALQLSLYAKPNGTGYSYGTIEVGIQTDIMDTNTYTKIGEAVASEWATSPAWEKREFVFDTYTAPDGVETYYVVIRHTEPYNSGNGWYIDDVQLEKAPICKKATNVSLTNLSNTGATVAWTQPGESITSWIVKYKATTEDNWQTQTTINADTTATLSSLTPTTTYELVIESECSEAEEGNPISDTLTFTTYCSATTIAENTPFTEDFEYTDVREVPSCWLKVAEGNTTVTYISGVSTEESYIGGKCLALKATIACERAIIALPEFTNPLSTLSLKFYSKAENLIYGGDLEIGYITNPLDSSTFVALTTISDTTNEWTLHEIDLAAYATQLANVTNARLAFSHYDPAITNSWYYYMVDELEVSLTPETCLAPTDLTIDSVAQTTASVSWTGTATSYDVQLNENAIENVTTTNKQFTDLTPNTTYTVKVRSNCTDTTSDWVTTTFTTLEEPIAPCDKPTNLEVVSTTNSLTLSWTGDATSYDVQLNEEAIQTTSQTTYTFTDLTPSTTYTLKVRSNCTETTSEWATITGITAAETIADPEVTTLTATANQTTATLTATVNANNNTIAKSGFNYRQAGETDWANVEVAIENGSMSADIEGLTPNTTYEYKAYVVTDKGTTFEGEVKTFTTQPSSLTDIENTINVLTYPNPTTTNATLEIKGLTEDANVVVTDVNGRVVLTRVYLASQASITIPTESLSAGVYYIKVTNSTMTKTQTLIKK